MHTKDERSSSIKKLGVLKDHISLFSSMVEHDTEKICKGDGFIFVAIKQIIFMSLKADLLPLLFFCLNNSQE